MGVKSKELLMLQDAWKRAWKSGCLDIIFTTKGGATRARMALYNAVRMAKQGKDEDAELCDAAIGVEIVWAGDLALRMQRRDSSDMLKGIASALGVSQADYTDPTMQESAERLMRELGGEQMSPLLVSPAPESGKSAVMEEVRALSPLPEYQDNPFYGKRG